MWYLMVFALAAMSALTIIQIPREWLKNKILRAFVIIYHSIGIASVALILFAVYRMKDGFLRELIVWTETVYFTLTLFGLFLSLVRWLAFEVARRFKHKNVLRALNSHTAFFLAVIGVSALYLVPSVYNATNLKTAEYNVNVEKTCSADNLSVTVVSDFHVGAGARRSEMDKMLEAVNAANSDVILICGDVCDSSSSVSDLEYMEQTLKKLSCRYGVYYAEGNHEKECRFDPDPYLSRAGVVILKDKGVRLENGVNIVGRKNELKKSAATIMDECGLNADEPTIVAQHRTKGLEQLDGVADLAVCGHTHGYQYPFAGLRMPVLVSVLYGYRTFGNTQAIVSSGVAEWGYRTKWPSKSEIVVINVNFSRMKTNLNRPQSRRFRSAKEAA